MIIKAQKEDWEKAKDTAFNKLNKKSNIDGFRPGKAPRNVFEKKYGKIEGDIPPDENVKPSGKHS